MAALLTEAFATHGLIWLAVTFVIAGLVRGFTGFGTALIFMPVGAIFLTVPQAIVAVTLLGMITWALVLPRALREGDKGEVGILALGALVTAPLGVWALTWVDGDLLRWGVSVAATLTLVAMVAGWRYTRQIGKAGLGTVGAAAGLLGGTTGLTVPPVILFYLAGAKDVGRVRANVILFLSALDIGLLANLLARDLVGGGDVALAVVLALPYAVGIAVGQALFDPRREVVYRRLAYVVIGAAILLGLPLFD